MLRRIFAGFTALFVLLGGLALGTVSAPPAGAATLPTGIWFETAALLDGGFDTEAVALDGGSRVLAVGFHKQASVYAFACNCWTPAGSANGTHPVTLADGRVLVFGSEGRASAYDPAANAWSDVAPMPFALPVNAATRLGDGRVLATSYNTAASSLVYDPAANAWTEVSFQPAASLVTLADGTALAIGPASSAVFDPAAMAWTGVPGPAEPHPGATAERLLDGRVLLVGGISGDGERPELFDPAIRTWAPAAPLHQVRWQHSSAVLADGRVLVTGGGTSDGTGLESTELYDPAADAWTPSAPLNHARTDFEAVAVERGNVLAVGGSPQPTELFGFHDFNRPDVLDVTVDPGVKRADTTASLRALVRSTRPVASVEWSPWPDGPWAPMATSDWHGYVQATATIGTDLAPGQYDVTVRATDDAGTTRTNTARLTVEQVDNDGPITRYTAVSPSAKRVDQPAELTTVTFEGDATGVEFFVDADPGQGAGTPMSFGFASSAGNHWTAQIGTDLAAGMHTVSTRAVDGWGNWGPVETVVLEVWADTEGPAMQAAYLAPNDRMANQESWLSAETTDPEAWRAEFYVDVDPGLGAGTPLTIEYDHGTTKRWSGVVGPLPEGEHTVSVRAQDVAGNWGPATALSLTVRPAVGPALEWAFAGPNPKPAHEEGWAMARGEESAAAAEYFLDADPGQGLGIPMQPWSSGWGFTEWFATLGTDIAPGEHTVSMRTVDWAGVWGPVTTVPLTVELDTTGPTLAAPQISPIPLRDDEEGWLSARIETGAEDLAGGEWFDGVDPGAGQGAPVEVYDGSPWGAPKELFARLPRLSAGTHQLGMRAVDVRGNWGPVATVTVTVIGDELAPRPLDAWAYPNPKQLDDTGWLYASFEEDRAVVRGEFFEGDDPGIGAATPAEVNAESSTSWSVFTWVPTDLASGDHVFGLRAADASGNWSETVFVTLTVIGDVTPPSVGDPSISPNPKWVREQATVVAPAADEFGVVGAEFFVGPDPGVGHGVPMTVLPDRVEGIVGTDVPVGSHAVGVRAFDANGNWSVGWTTLEVWEDTTPPTISLLAASPMPKAVGETAFLTVAADDDRGVVGGEYRVDGGAATALSPSLTASLGEGLGVGEHTVSARVRDGVGNWSEWSSLSLPVYDPNAPRLSGGGPLDRSASSDGGRSSFKIDGSYSDPGNRFAEGRLDITTATATLSATVFDWLAVDAASGTFSGVAQATSRSGEAWTVRFRGTTGAASSVSFELYRAGSSTPAVTVSGPTKERFVIAKR